MPPRELTAWILLGAALALPYVLYARRRRFAFAAGLIVAAVIYVGLALFGSSTGSVVVELGGVLLFAAIAAAGQRWSSLFLAAGWLAHVAWDLLLHELWLYPAVCIGFDVFVAGFIVALTRDAVGSPRRTPPSTTP